MANAKYLMHVQYASPALENKWSPLLTKTHLYKWLKAACKNPCEFTLRFVNAKEGQGLNRMYRGQNHATNILTFPFSDKDSERITADLVFCMPVIEKEAKLQGKTSLNHFIHLLVHGILHAQGFEHEDPIEALAMETLEVAILRRLKLDNPYI